MGINKQKNEYIYLCVTNKHKIQTVHNQTLYTIQKSNYQSILYFYNKSNLPVKIGTSIYIIKNYTTPKNLKLSQKTKIQFKSRSNYFPGKNKYKKNQYPQRKT